MITAAHTKAEQFSDLSDNARVWIYQSDRRLNESECAFITAEAGKFLSEWNAHGTKMAARLSVLFNRFVVLAADESQVKASGCSIDSSVRFLQSVQQALNIDLFNRMNIAYRNASGDIETATLPVFQDMIAAGTITPETMVFNNLVDTLDALKNQWEVPCSDSWHARLFR